VVALLDEDRAIYVEPIQDYLARKHFYIGLASSALLLLLTIDLLFFGEIVWSLATYAFHAVLMSVAAVLLFVERRVWRYQRFRVFEDGFVLAGYRTLLDGGRFVRFDQIASAEAVATAGGSSRRTLLYLTVRLQPVSDLGYRGGASPEEIVIASDELRHRNLVRLWREFVARGLGNEDVLRWMESTT